MNEDKLNEMIFDEINRSDGIIKTTDKDGWRWYGDKISITSLLSNTIANPKLQNWMKNNSANKVEKVKEATASFGTISHELFEKILSNKEYVVPPTHQAQADQFIKWSSENNVIPIHLEKQVVSDTYGVAGTCDFIGYINGELVVADWKTGVRYQITNGWQMAFYRLAAIEMGLVDKKCGLIGVQINRNTAEVKTFKYTHIDFVTHMFLSSWNVFRGLYWNKLNALNWPWLHGAQMEIK